MPFDGMYGIDPAGDPPWWLLEVRVSMMEMVRHPKAPKSRALVEILQSRGIRFFPYDPDDPTDVPSIVPPFEFFQCSDFTVVVRQGLAA